MNAETAGWDPEDQARADGVDVRVSDRLPEGLQACVDHRKRIIWLRPGLSADRRRSAVAYELGVLHQGPASADPQMARAQELAALEWAAFMLIDGEDLAFAFRLSTDLDAIAGHLQVDLPMLRARLRAMTDGEQDAWLEALTTAI